ncbi:hypothetical protein GQ42DRAFT_162443 [Ramicandelaber brevisporus]|nr:hypothetical protein GQ42DRAFT_162443 [Ramicandelaber brevisporus]
MSCNCACWNMNSLNGMPAPGACSSSANSNAKCYGCRCEPVCYCNKLIGGSGCQGSGGYGGGYGYGSGGYSSGYSSGNASASSSCCGTPY